MSIPCKEWHARTKTKTLFHTSTPLPNPPPINPKTTSTHQPSSRPPKSMRLRIQHPLIQRDNIGRSKQQIKVLERLRQPKALHAVLQVPFRRGALHGRNVADGGVAHLGCRRGYDSLVHAPAFFLPRRIA